MPHYQQARQIPFSHWVGVRGPNGEWLVPPVRDSTQKGREATDRGFESARCDIQVRSREHLAQVANSGYWGTYLAERAVALLRGESISVGLKRAFRAGLDVCVDSAEFAAGLVYEDVGYDVFSVLLNPGKLGVLFEDANAPVATPTLADGGAYGAPKAREIRTRPAARTQPEAEPAKAKASTRRGRASASGPDTSGAPSADDL